jgi:hypothetical protein
MIIEEAQPIRMQSRSRKKSHWLPWMLFAVVGACGHEAGQMVLANPDQPRGALGRLAGTVTQGPVSPLGGRGQPLSEPAGGVRILIEDMSGHQVGSVVTDNQGRYQVELPEGTYRVKMPPLPGLKFTKDLPATVGIGAGRDSRLDIYIDTGIR